MFSINYQAGFRTRLQSRVKQIFTHDEYEYTIDDLKHIFEKVGSPLIDELTDIT